MYGTETCRSGINILNILFTSHMHFVGFKSFNFEKFMVQATKRNEYDCETDRQSMLVTNH
jgi:hypothetical protein